MSFVSFFFVLVIVCDCVYYCLLCFLSVVLSGFGELRFSPVGPVLGVVDPVGVQCSSGSKGGAPAQTHKPG